MREKNHPTKHTLANGEAKAPRPGGWGALLLLLLLCACTRTEYIAVPEYHFVGTNKMIATHDSVFVHDSIYNNVYTVGDTVHHFRDRTKMIYRDRQVRDTLIVETRDTVTAILPSETRTEVKYQTAWYDKVCRVLALALTIVVIAVAVTWLARRRK